MHKRVNKRVNEQANQIASTPLWETWDSLLLLSNFSHWILSLSICSKLSSVFWSVTSTLECSDSEIARFYPFHSIPNAPIRIQIQARITKASPSPYPVTHLPQCLRLSCLLYLYRFAYTILLKWLYTAYTKHSLSTRTFKAFSNLTPTHIFPAIS